MKFAHLSDTHIKLLKEHDSYRMVFDEIYKILKEEKVDAVIHTGDLFHTKIQLTPEAISMATDFLRSLADIAPLYIIPGNHDTNLKNNSRMDSITPIIQAINHSNIFYLKVSGEKAISDNFSLNAFSLLDQQNWSKPSNPEKINIALFHGSVAGVKTDIGYVMEHGEFDINIFDGHDYAFCGDIHMSNQILDTEGKVRYCGSTVQQNFGETDDKGFLIWDITSKDDFTCKHYAIPNPHPYVTFTLDDSGLLPSDIEAKAGSRIRIVADKSVTLEKIKKATEVVKSRFKPESVNFVNKSTSNSNLTSQIEGIGHVDNLRDLVVQERLIRDYLKDFKAEEEIINKVLELNKKFSSAIEEGEDINRGVRWSLKELEWDYLFNYGEGNKINFEQLSGIVGVFGKNYSGKSSVIDGLLYTLFNTTSKNNRKNLNVINQNQKNGRGKIVVDIDDAEYSIERKSEKYTKKVKGVETVEAKTDVEFTSSNESLNGLARNDTDKNIRRFFGTVDDFFLTSMAAQFGYLSFISEGSTKRKEILAKFLDLENFDKKFKLGKEESAELKAMVKKLEGVDYKRDINVAETQLVSVDSEISNKKLESELLRKKIFDANEKFSLLQKCIAEVPSSIINYDDEKQKLDNSRFQTKQIVEENIVLNGEINRYQELLSKIDDYLNGVDEQDLIEKEKQLEILNEQIRILEREFATTTTEVSNAEKKIGLLDQVPCGDKFPTCKFIRDAFAAKDTYGVLKNNYDAMNNSLQDLGQKFDVLDEEVTSNLNKLNDIKRKRVDTNNKLSSCQLKIEKNKNVLIVLERNITDAVEKLKEYDLNRESIENYEKLLTDCREAKNNVDSLTKQLNKAEHDLMETYKVQGSINAKIEIFNKQALELEDLRKQYTAYHLFLTCMHPNGISYEIIKSKLPEINQEIAKILANIVEFSIYLENDDDKLDIMIKHPKYEARPLEMGSGAEKTLASTAIRLALLSVTTLPKGNIIIFDEPGTALDSENVDGFIKILDVVKQYFDIVLVISHLDALKDAIDTQIIIQKKDGYAYVNI